MRAILHPDEQAVGNLLASLDKTSDDPGAETGLLASCTEGRWRIEVEQKREELDNGLFRETSLCHIMQRDLKDADRNKLTQMRRASALQI